VTKLVEFDEKRAAAGRASARARVQRMFDERSTHVEHLFPDENAQVFDSNAHTNSTHVEHMSNTAYPTSVQASPSPSPSPSPYTTQKCDARIEASVSQEEKPRDRTPEIAERMYAIHPKHTGKMKVLGALRMAAKATGDGRWEEALMKIEACHAAWVKTEDWTKDNARFCPSLDKWLSDEGFAKWPSGASPNGNGIPPDRTVRAIKEDRERRRKELGYAE